VSTELSIETPGIPHNVHKRITLTGQRKNPKRLRHLVGVTGVFTDFVREIVPIFFMSQYVYTSDTDENNNRKNSA